MAGSISDTRDLLRGVSDPARESYYKRSTSRRPLLAVVIVVFLAVAVIGVAVGGFSGYVVASSGVFGLAVVSIWLILH